MGQLTRNEVFTLAVQRYSDTVYRTAVHNCRCTADAEDVVQEAFIKLWYIREKLDAYHSVEALAMQVTKNLSLDKIKLRKPQGSELESVTLISEAVSPDEQLEQKDAAECIRRLIAQLPTLQQTIIRMKDIEGYELAEIAEITATPVENVRVNLSRARKKIREQFLQLNKQEKWT